MKWTVLVVLSVVFDCLSGWLVGMEEEEEEEEYGRRLDLTEGQCRIATELMFLRESVNIVLYLTSNIVLLCSLTLGPVCYTD